MLRTLALTALLVAWPLAAGDRVYPTLKLPAR
jgi:hypothetical protein